MTESPDTRKRDSALLRGGSWTLLSRVITQLVQFSIFIVAAKLMTPEEFGVFALIGASIVILNQVAIAGWPEYIMQWHGDSFRLRQALFVAALSGGAITMIGLGFAFVTTWFTEMPEAVLVAQLLAISVFFSSTGNAYAGVLNWQNKLTAAAICAILAELANLIVSIWALLEGLGILALAYGRLVNSIVAFVAFALFAREIPTSQISFPQLKEMFVFSKHFIVMRVLSNLEVYASTFIVGGALGAAAAGYYRLAQRIVVGFEEIIGEPSRVLAWSMFRRVRDAEGDIGGFDALSQVFFRMQIYVGAPLFIGIAVLAPDFIEGLLGSEWAPAAPLMQILALVSLIRIASHATLPILSLARKTALLPKYTLIFSLISVVFIAVGASIGMIATAVAELLAALVIFAINAWVTQRHANLFWLKILSQSWRVLPAVGLAVLLPLIFREFGFFDAVHPLARVISLCLLMMLIYFPILVVLDHSLRQRIADHFGSHR